MAARIIENDFGTKKATRETFQKLQGEIPAKFKAMMKKYWKVVLKYAKEECPVGTPASTGIPGYIGGSLRRTLRIQEGGASKAKYERGASGKFVDQTSLYIIAGGGGIWNPNNRREVDYAQAVHDGYFTGGKKRITLPVGAGLTKTGRRKTRMTPSGRWVAGRPFLTRAMQRAAPEFEEILKEFLDGVSKTWVSNQPSASGVAP